MTLQNSSGGEAPPAGLLPESTIDRANFQAVVLLTIAMAMFALDDMFIKLASERVGVYQALAVQCVLAGLYFGFLACRRGQRITRDSVFTPTLLLRHTGDMMGAICFVLALAKMPISNASAILQASPLMVTFGAAVLLRETVGWRRWTAVVIGFLGVMLVVRPGLEGFNGASLLAVGAAVGLAVRDVLTRAIPKSIPTEIVALVADIFVLTAAIVAQTISGPWQLMNAETTALVFGAGAFGIAGIHLMTVALRAGEVSLIAPYRYTRIVFATLIGMIVFAERPDGFSIAGSLLIVASGLYTLYRERVARLRNTRRT